MDYKEGVGGGEGVAGTPGPFPSITCEDLQVADALSRSYMTIHTRSQSEEET